MKSLIGYFLERNIHPQRQRWPVPVCPRLFTCSLRPHKSTFDNFDKLYNFDNRFSIFLPFDHFDRTDTFVKFENLTFLHFVYIFNIPFTVLGQRQWNKDNGKYNPRICLHLRHWLLLWQLRTWIHDNLCNLTINCDTGQHSQLLQCFLLHWYPPKSFKYKKN